MVSFDSTLTSSITVNQGGGSGTNLTWASVLFTNPAGNVVINQNGANNTLTLNSGGINMSGATADLTFNSGSVRFASANYSAIFNVASGRTLTLNNVANQGNNKTLSLTGSGNVVVNGVIGNSATAPLALNINGANLTLNGSTNFNLGSGSLTLTSGSLNLGNDNALVQIAGSKALTILGGTLTASGGSRTVAVAGGYTLGGDATVGGTNNLNLSSTLLNSGGNRTLAVNNSALTTLTNVNLSESTTNRTLTINGTGNVAITGVVSNNTSSASALTYSGSGTLTLSGANTYTGATTISAGVLVVDGSLAAGTTTTVGMLGKLGGSGTLNGPVTVNGTHAPGNSPGFQTFSGGLSYASGSHLSWDLVGNTSSNRGTSYDGVDVSGGAFNLASGSIIDLVLSGVNFANAFWDSNQAWQVVRLSGTATAADTNVFSLGAISGGDPTGQGSFSSTRESNGDVMLRWTAVPEASASALLALAALAGLRRRRAGIRVP